MFAYCLNNPSNRVDRGGKDAIWIQETNSAEGFGHAGLLIQDENGVWYFFFWGPSREDEANPDLGQLIDGVNNGCYCIPIDVTDIDLSTDGGVKAAMEKAGGEIASRLYQDDGTETIILTRYFAGDYTAALDKAKKYESSKAQYKLLARNCDQVSLDCMIQSDYRFAHVANSYLNCTYPNLTFSRVSILPTSQSDFWGNFFALMALTGGN